MTITDNFRRRGDGKAVKRGLGKKTTFLMQFCVSICNDVKGFEPLQAHLRGQSEKNFFFVPFLCPNVLFSSMIRESTSVIFGV